MQYVIIGERRWPLIFCSMLDGNIADVNAAERAFASRSNELLINVVSSSFVMELTKIDKSACFPESSNAVFIRLRVFVEVFTTEPLFFFNSEISIGLSLLLVPF